MPFNPGDPVHVTSLGKAIVREVRNGGRYLVELKGRTLLVTEAQLTAVENPKRVRTIAAPPVQPAPSSHAPIRSHAASSIDLHGMTTDEAIAAVDAFLNEALLASLDEVRIVHGRSGGRLKAAVHARLRALPSIRSFGIDRRNPGVTIVTL
jgi:DNA mismatch repair protein MutS2